MLKQHDERRRENDLVEAIQTLACELKQFREQVRVDSETISALNRVEQKLDNIMQAITEFSNRVNAAFDAIGTSVDEIVMSQAGIAGDVAGLKAIIEKLQTTPGALTPEDQALLDALDAKVLQLQGKTTAVSEALKALDAQTDEVPAPQP